MPIHKWKLPLKRQVVNTETAKKLATILIQLQKDYPLFFKDVNADDPDLDMDVGFKAYEIMEQG
jgi:hypothetical protein